MPSREEAKEIRRRRILDAARTLIRQTGKAGFSMRALAQQADVSLVTPYNLFGSKQSIMFALLDRDLQEFAVQLAKSRKDPLDMLFRAVSLGRTYFEKQPEYYKAVLFAVYSDGGTEYRSMFRGPRRALWRRLVDDAVTGGYLRKDVASDPFALNLAAIYFANILEWVAGEMSLEEMEMRTLYGFAMSLYAQASADQHARLRNAISRYQKKVTGTISG